MVGACYRVRCRTNGVGGKKKKVETQGVKEPQCVGVDFHPENKGHQRR